MSTASLKELNASAYQYQEAVATQFQSICEPLFKLGIKYFDYFRVYNDGYYLRLINNLTYSNVYLSAIKDNGLFFTEKIKSVEMDKSYYFLLNDISCFDKKKDPIMHLMYDFNMWNAFYIYRLRNPDFIEGYIFMMSRDDVMFSQFYLNSIPLLEHFTVYFNEKAHNLINCNDKRKLSYFKQQFYFNNISKEALLIQKAEKFIQETQIKRRILKTKEKEISLSKRELECLSYIALGKSMKETARILDLSPRTVESYLQNLKQKSGLKRGALLTHFIENRSLSKPCSIC